MRFVSDCPGSTCHWILLSRLVRKLNNRLVLRFLTLSGAPTLVLLLVAETGLSSNLRQVNRTTPFLPSITEYRGLLVVGCNGSAFSWRDEATSFGRNPSKVEYDWRDLIWKLDMSFLFTVWPT